MNHPLASEMGYAIGRAWRTFIPYTILFGAIQREPWQACLLAALLIAAGLVPIVGGYVLLRAVFRRQCRRNLSRSLIALGQPDQRQ